MDILKISLSVVLAIVLIDVVILSFTILAIAMGQQVSHIPFWDMQIKAVVAILA